jgi:hypothetical protein
MTGEPELLGVLVALALAGGLHLPSLLVAPLLLALAHPGGSAALAVPELASPGLALLGLGLGGLLFLARSTPLGRTGVETGSLAMAVLLALHLPALPSGGPGGLLLLAEGVALGLLAAAGGGARLGARFLRTHIPHPPAFLAILDPAPTWPVPGAALPALALVAGALLLPPVGASIALALLCLLALLGRGPLRAAAFALRALAREMRVSPSAPDTPPSWATDGEGAAGVPGLLIERSGAAPLDRWHLRSGWLLVSPQGTPGQVVPGEGGAGQTSPGTARGPDEGVRFRYRTLFRVWEEALLPRVPAEGGPLAWTGLATLVPLHPPGGTPPSPDSEAPPPRWLLVPSRPGPRVVPPGNRKKAGQVNL